MKNSNMVGLKSRKERRQEARTNKVSFTPQYSQEPMRVQHKDVLKIQINEDRRRAKKN